MYPELLEAKYVKDYRIWVKFADKTEGEIDLEKELYGEIFEPLKNIQLFKSFSIHAELRTIFWSNGADLSPEFIYETIKQAA